MNAIQQPGTLTTLSALEQRDVASAADRIRAIGTSVARIGTIMTAVQAQLLEKEAPHEPCNDCRMHQLVTTPTLFALYTAIEELGEIVYTLADNIETTIHRAHLRKGSA
jgi:hypothetical protein